MSATILYVYAIGRELSLVELEGQIEGVDGTSHFSAIALEGLTGVYSEVSAEEFSQEKIDSRADDLNWIGSVGYRHQAVIGRLAQTSAVIPLRAFTLFSSPERLLEFLSREEAALRATLSRLAGKDEWTIRIEFDPELWSKALVQRVVSLSALESEIASAPEGRAYLLRKKLDDAKRNAAREAEESVVREINEAFERELHAESIVETRESRNGSFPQINFLIDRGRTVTLDELHHSIASKYAREGVRLVLTGPWPPYSFAGAANHE